MITPRRNNFIVNVEDLPAECVETDLIKLLQPCGKVNAVTIHRQHQQLANRQNSVAATLEFQSREHAEIVMQFLDSNLIWGRKLRVQLMVPATAAIPSVISGALAPGAKPTRSAQVHISYLTKQLGMLVTEQIIFELFSNFGRVLEVSLKKKCVDTEMSIQNGYGFVHYPLTNEGIDSALRAVDALHQVTINNISYDCSVSNQLRQVLFNTGRLLKKSDSPQTQTSSIPVNLSQMPVVRSGSGEDMSNGFYPQGMASLPPASSRNSNWPPHQMMQSGGDEDRLPPMPGSLATIDSSQYNTSPRMLGRDGPPMVYRGQEFMSHYAQQQQHVVSPGKMSSRGGGGYNNVYAMPPPQLQQPHRYQQDQSQMMGPVGQQASSTYSRLLSFNENEPAMTGPSSWSSIGDSYGATQGRGASGLSMPPNFTLNMIKLDGSGPSTMSGSTSMADDASSHKSLLTYATSTFSSSNSLRTGSYQSAPPRAPGLEIPTADNNNLLERFGSTSKRPSPTMTQPQSSELSLEGLNFGTITNSSVGGGGGGGGESSSLLFGTENHSLERSSGGPFWY